MANAVRKICTKIGNGHQYLLGTAKTSLYSSHLLSDTVQQHSTELQVRTAIIMGEKSHKSGMFFLYTYLDKENFVLFCFFFRPKKTTNSTMPTVYSVTHHCTVSKINTLQWLQLNGLINTLTTKIQFHP